MLVDRGVWVRVAAMAIALLLGGTLLLAPIRRSASPRCSVPELEILGDLAEWRTASGHARVSAARHAAQFTHGLELIGMRRFASDAESIELALARHVRSGLEFCLIPAGSVRGGRRLHQPLWMSRTECTRVAYGAVDASASTRVEDGKLPASMISWDEAHEWCSQNGMRLPRVSEWLYCSTISLTNDDSSDALWAVTDRFAYLSKSRFDERLRAPIAVATLASNAFGLFDMIGNVEEWVVDGSQYDPSFPNDETGREVATFRYICGGSFEWTASEVQGGMVRFDAPTLRSQTIGFRPCIDLAAAVRAR